MSSKPREKLQKPKSKAIQSAKPAHKPNLSMGKLPEKGTKSAKVRNEDKEMKEMVKEIREPKENRRNVKTANSSHRSIPRNINEYRHLISGFDGGFNITENDIDWVLKLRSPDNELLDKSRRVTDHLYSFYGRNLESQQQGRKTNTDLNMKGNVNSIDHLLRGRIGATADLGVVLFETSLRSSDKINAELKEKEKRWSTIPKKDRKEFPAFLPNIKEEIKLKKTINGDLNKLKLETAFDPDTFYPKYQEKFRYKNLNNLTHLLKPGNTLPMVQWQLSLR